MSEGISIPCVDTILIMDKRNSERVLIQIIGRALRKFDGKELSLICFPIDCSDTIEMALTALTYDAKDKNRIRKNILTVVETIRERDKIVEQTNKKLIMIECEMNGVGGLVNYKIELLNKVVFEENGGKLVLKQFKTEDGILLGCFQDRLIRSLSSPVFIFKNIDIWKEKYIELFKLLNQRVFKIENERENKVDISPNEKIVLLNKLIFEENNGKLIFKTYKTNDKINIGSFQDNLIGALSGRNKHYYKNEIPNWKQKYPKLFELFEKRVSKIKNKREKVDISPDEKIKLINTITKEKGKLISSVFKTKDGISLGSFKDSLISTLSGKRNHYKDDIHKWRQTYPELFKLLDERVKTILDKRT